MIKYTYLRLKPGVEKIFVELDPNPTRVANLGKPKLVILVVGESDRASNHQLNGYSKQTNPRLSLRNDIYSFNSWIKSFLFLTIKYLLYLQPLKDFSIASSKVLTIK